VLLVACLLAALVLARWWASRSEAVFQARLQEAPLAELQKIARERDWDPQVFYWLGARLTTEGRHKEATEALTRSVKLNPGSAAARAALGLALARTERPGEAEEQLREALTIDPKLQFAHFALGNLYGKYGRWGTAAEALKVASRLNPDDLEAQYLLALCYGELFQEDKKLEILERLVRRAPDEVRFLRSLGIVYLFFGKFAQAEAMYRRILAQTPDDLETRYLLGRALAEQASTPEAFASAEQVLKGVAAEAPENPQVHLALGILHFRRNEPAAAVSALEKAVRLGITETKTYNYLGQAYMRAGRTEDAKRTLEKFQKLASTNRTISHLENRILNLPEETAAQKQEKVALRLRLAQVYLDSGNLPHVQDQLRLIAEKDPSNPEARKLEREYDRRVQAAPPAKTPPPTL
jgi:Flp pilus assembly protein TadD